MSYDPVPPFRRDFDAARDPYTARNALGISEATGGPPAPASAPYVTSSADATLTNERVLTNTATVTWDFSTAGQAKANATGLQASDPDLTSIAGYGGTGTWLYRSAADTWSPVTIGGNLTFTGGTLNTAVTPQPLDATLTALAAFNTNGLLVQTAADTFAGRTLTQPAAGLTITNPAGTAGNPTFALADDLAALEALAGTSTIYYRSGTSAWTAVTIGGAMTFSAGTLNAYGGALPGTSTNDNAAAGQVGEFSQANKTTGSGSLTSGAIGTYHSTTLSAGDWDVWVHSSVTAASTPGTMELELTTGSSLTGNNLAYVLTSLPSASATHSVDIQAVRFSLSTSTTINLNYRVGITGTVINNAYIAARRRR